MASELRRRLGTGRGYARFLKPRWHGSTCTAISSVLMLLAVPSSPMTRTKDGGGWYASAHLRADVAAFGEGDTREAAIANLRACLELLLEGHRMS